MGVPLAGPNAPVGKIMPPRPDSQLPQNECWMRAVRFSAMHRILKIVAGAPAGLTAGELNSQISARQIALTRRHSPPAPTTFYHYRNTMVRLGLLKRIDRKLHVDRNNLDVAALLREQVVADGLTDAARDRFSSLVLQNEQCRSLFFDLFMPDSKMDFSVSGFRRDGNPVEWERIEPTETGTKGVIFRKSRSSQTICRKGHSEVNSILYGVRYWARDELKLVDEFCRKAGWVTVMFPLSGPGFSDQDVWRTANLILSARSASEWTVLSILDLIAHCCVKQRQPVEVLFEAIGLLLREWSDHIVLIPTTRSLATLAADSPLKEELALRSYYKSPRGPYISHIRIHQDIPLSLARMKSDHVQHLAEAQA